MDTLVHQVLYERYQIQSLLGRKTGRRTFLARDLQTQSTVVIKLLLFGPDFTWDDLKLFQREAEILSQLDHAALPQYLDSFEVDTELGKGFALVQSYIEARSLQDWIQSGRHFNETELKVIAESLLGILDYLHRQQPPVIHRDIKPSNILLGDRSGNSPGQVYLIDFGSVQIVSHGGTVTVVGTYGYMPPEQFGGRSSPASDLYALGATLIYLATGQHPADLPQQDLRIEFEQFTTLNQSLIRWIQWLTEPSLSNRLTSASEALQYFPCDASSIVPYGPKTLKSSQYLALGVRPKNSKIELLSTPAGLEIAVPATQIIIKPGREIHSLLNRCRSFGGAVVFIALICTGFPLVILLFLVYYLVRGIIALFSRRPEFYRVLLQSQGKATTISLAPIGTKKKVVFSRERLLSITVGPYVIPQYKLTITGQNFGDAFYIIGSRSEIQWLCDELDEVVNFRIEYRDDSSG